MFCNLKVHVLLLHQHSESWTVFFMIAYSFLLFGSSGILMFFTLHFWNPLLNLSLHFQKRLKLCLKLSRQLLIKVVFNLVSFLLYFIISVRRLISLFQNFFPLNFVFPLFVFYFIVSLQ